MTYRSRLAIWFAVNAVVLTAIAAAGRSETCAKAPDVKIEKQGGYRWQYRNVDGRQCWYYSNRILPATDLVWSFSEEEFNSDVRVLERKLYLDRYHNIVHD